MIRVSTFIIFFSLWASSVFAIIPPAKGVTTDAKFRQAQFEISKSYSGGYYAEHFRKREILRQQIAEGLRPASELTIDTVFALTLLGKYSDANPIYQTQALQNQIFSGPSATGTVTDYYREISYNQMHFTGACKGWYPVPGTLASYVGNNTGLGVQGGPRFVLDVISASDADVNYSNYIQYYDTQGNPRIGFIAVIHTGADAAAGANNIWSHRWSFTVATNGQPFITNDIDPVSGKAVIIDGDYAIQPELKGNSNVNGSIIDIGVFAHEFGHIFGLPDLYDTDNSSAGLGNWCLMAGGSYGGDGASAHTPVHMSAWCKKELGWITPQTVTSYNPNYSIASTTETPSIVKMWRSGQPNSQEYFLIENRQKIGFDHRLYNPGLLIYHIDETQGGNTNENRRLVDLEQADGLRSLNTTTGRGDGGDPYPGATNNRRFDQSTNPNSSAYTSGVTHVSVRNIRQSGSQMIADLDIGTIAYLNFNNLYFTEISPNDGRIAQGETANIKIDVKNISPVQGNSITAEIFINDSAIELLNTSTSDSIGALAAKTITIAAAFRVKPEFKSKMLWVRYRITSPGNIVEDSLRVVVGIPDVLVISKSENKSDIAYYDSALTHSSVDAEINFSSIPEFVTGRKLIIYTTGNKKDSIFTSAEIDTLKHYMAAGGRIFFTGQNIAEYLQLNYPSFLHDELGIKWVKNNSPLTKTAYGITNDPIGSVIPFIRFNGTDGAANESSTDVLADTNGFTLAYSYKSTSTEGAAGWKHNIVSGSKLFFMGFGFESIHNTLSSLSRNNIMEVLLNWFDISTSISEKTDFTATGYYLFNNYPNPFNPSTKITYQIPLSGKVEIILFDITGKQIAVLLNSEQNSGLNSVEIQADALGLSSGVYFVRMKVLDFTQTNKIMLLK